MMKQAIAILLAGVMLTTSVQIPVRADELNESKVECDLEEVINQYEYDKVDDKTAKSAQENIDGINEEVVINDDANSPTNEVINNMSSGDGIELNNGKYERWVDRCNLPQYALDFYDKLIEATDNDGVSDYLIDRKYYNGPKDPNEIKEGYEGVIDMFGTPPSETAFKITSFSNTKVNTINYELINKNLGIAYQCFLYDHPEVFWLQQDGGVNLIYTQKGGDVEVYLWITTDMFLELHEVYGKEHIDDYFKKINDIVSKAKGNDYEKIKYFHDYLTENNSYNSIVAANPGSDGFFLLPYSHTSYSAIMGKVGEEGPVCDGYAKAFKVLCEKAGIPCVFSDGGKHAWNIVKIDGKWYGVDVTWDDDSAGIKKSGKENRNYLLVGSNSIVSGSTFSSGHITENKISPWVVDCTHQELNSCTGRLVNEIEMSAERYTGSNSQLVAVNMFPAKGDNNCNITIAPTIYFSHRIEIKNRSGIVLRNITDSKDIPIKIGINGDKNAIKIAPLSELEQNKLYIVIINEGAICEERNEGNILHTINDWNFATITPNVNNETKYIGLSYPKTSGGIFGLLKVDDKTKPGIPNKDESDLNYGKELKYWAKQFGVTDIANLSDSDAAMIVNKSAELPMISTDNEIVLAKNNNTIRTLMSDVVFISEMQKHLDELDKQALEASSTNKLVSLYSEYLKLIDQSNKYLKERTKGSSSDFNTTILTPFLMSTKITKVTDATDLLFTGMNYNNIGGDLLTGYKFQRTYLTLKSDTDVSVELKDIANAEKYGDFINKTKQLYSNIKSAKKLYKAVDGGTKGIVKYFGLNYIENTLINSNDTVKFVYDSYQKISDIAKPLRFALLAGGSSMVYGTYIIKLEQKLMQDLDNYHQSWFFWLNYYVQFKYPLLYEDCLDDNLNLISDIREESGLQGAFQAFRNCREFSNNWQKDQLLYQWANYLDSSSFNYVDNIAMSREIPNMAFLYHEIQTVDLNEMMFDIVKLASAKKNQGKSSVVKISCPVIINVYDENNNYITSLSSDNTSGSEFDSYISTYLMGDDNETKCFVVDDNKYHFEIIPYDNGTMDVEVDNYDGDKICDSILYDDISIKENESFELNLYGNSNIELISPEGSSVNKTENIGIESIHIDNDICEMYVGEIFDLQTSIYPLYATNKNLEYSSSNDFINIDEYGTVRAICAGESTITVKSKEDSSIYDCINITIIDPISKIDFDINDIEISVGESVALQPLITPSDSAEKIEWGSYDSSIATVEDGIVRAIAKGEVYIYCNTANVKEELLIKVNNWEDYSIALNKESIDIEKEKSEQLAVELKDGDGNIIENPEIEWSSEDEKIARVKDGLIYAVDIGRTFITAKYKGKTVTCIVSVIENEDSYNLLLEKEFIDVEKGKTEQLIVAVKDRDGNTIENPEIEWSSDDEKIVTVENGLIYAVGIGRTIVKGTYKKKTVTCIVNVISKDDFYILLNKESIDIEKGNSDQLIVMIKDSDGNAIENPEIEWSSDNETIATVEDGLIYAVDVGKTIVTATYKGKAAKCYVIVNEKDRFNKRKDKISEKEYVLHLATKEKIIISELAKETSGDKNYKLAYSSMADKKIANVNKKGLIVAKKAGISKIQITKGDKVYIVTVHVSDPKFSAKKYTMKVGEKFVPEYDNCKLQTAFSLDKGAIKKGLATINTETGEITALKNGKVKVTATVGEGKMARKVTASVKIER